MKKITSFMFYTMILAFAICIPISVQAKTKVSTPVKVRVRSNESKKLKVTWNKVKKADGYQIYEYKKSSKKFKKVADVGSKTESWKSKNTKKYILTRCELIKKQAKRKCTVNSAMR